MMNLVSLSLNNIRSYKDEEISFRNGVTLFEGDIGSGKSSILNAVEFALFGLGDQNGSHLLRVGENEGKVELTIDINGKQVTFGRSLTRKRNTVSQDQCYIVEEGVKTSYNATNMKRRALQILEFKEPTNPRSQSVIYRYAVFTPQEQMREVIRQRPENRKETLRKALGVEEYSIAADNASSILTNLRGEAKTLESSIGEAELIKTRVEEEENAVTETTEAIVVAEKRLSEIKIDKEKTNARLAEKEAERTNRDGVLSQLALLDQEKARLEEDLNSNAEELSETKEKLASARESDDCLKKLAPLYDELRSIRKEMPRLQAQYDLEKSFKQKIENIRTEIKTRREQLEAQLEEEENEIAELTDEVQKLDGELTRLTSLSAEITRLEEETASLEDLKEDNIEKQSLLSSTQQVIRQLETQKEEKITEWDTISSIGVGAVCPHCQQKLSETHYRLLEKKLNAEINEIKLKLADQKTAFEKLSGDVKNGRKRQSDLERLVIRLNGLRLELVALEKDEATRDRYLSELDSAKEKLGQIEQQLLDDAFASKQKNEIADLEPQVNELKPYVEQYLKLRGRGLELDKLKIEEEYVEAKSLADRVSEFTEKISKLESDKAELKSNQLEKTRQYGILSGDLKKYEGLDSELSALRSRENKLSGDEGGIRTQILSYQSTIESAELRIKRLNDDLSRHQKNILEAESLQLVVTWLREVLIPSFQTIEKNILLSLNQEFNKMFKRWFGELIESDELQGMIDEDFTPIVEQSGYGLDVESLSGGEKTSVALAYRLALNTIVKQVTNTMRNNLLILDEPTDGFSKEQLFKMRDILNELDSSQVILVSHEKELETVADYIYRVRKEGNTSRVTPPN